MESLGILAELTGQFPEAEQRYLEAVELRRALDYPSGMASTLALLGALHARGKRAEEARPYLAEALRIARESGAHSSLVLATCYLALLPGGDATSATNALAVHGGRLSRGDTLHARLCLWDLTGDMAHLEEAKRLLDLLVEHAPEEYRESIVGNVRIHRQVMDAWESRRTS